MGSCVTLSCRARSSESVRPWHGLAKSQVETFVLGCCMRVGRPLSNLRALAPLPDPSDVSFLWRHCFCRSSKVVFLRIFHMDLPPLRTFYLAPTHQNSFLMLGSWCSCDEVDSSELGIWNTGFGSQFCPLLTLSLTKLLTIFESLFSYL